MNVVAAGDCGIDRYVNLQADRAGGITLNFAVNARQFLASDDIITVITALGDDRGASMVLDVLNERQVQIAHQVVPGDSSTQYIDRHPSGEKHFTRYEAGVLADYKLSLSQRRLIAECDWLIVPYYREIDTFFNDVITTPCNGRRVVDFGALKARDERLAIVRRHLDALHIGVFGLNENDEDLIESLEHLARAEHKLFVVTLGEQGAIALGGHQRIYCPSVPVEHVEDTTGAGDTFLAAFLASYIHKKTVMSALQAGAKAASITVSNVGAFDAPLIAWPSTA